LAWQLESKLKVCGESAWADATTALSKTTMIRILYVQMHFSPPLLHSGDDEVARGESSWSSSVDSEFKLAHDAEV
jgi:hypothetical protein